MKLSQRLLRQHSAACGQLVKERRAGRMDCGVFEMSVGLLLALPIGRAKSPQNTDEGRRWISTPAPFGLWTQRLNLRACRQGSKSAAIVGDLSAFQHMKQRIFNPSTPDITHCFLYKKYIFSKVAQGLR